MLVDTMAQFLTLISLVFLLFLAKTFVQKVDSKNGDNMPTTTYDEWYQSGVHSYTKEDWEDTIYYFENALAEFKFYRSSLAECRLKCRNASTRHSSPLADQHKLEEIQYFQGLFQKANCVRKCKFDKLGNRPQLIENDVTDKFLGRMPYSYLQFAYYKSFEYEKAVAAAYTYMQWNPEDEVMQNNLNYYRNLHGINEDHLVDLEQPLHHKYFMQGYKAYEKEDFGAVVENMLKALEYYWKADEECRALCEGKYENREFMDLYEAISNHYASVVYCKSQCEDWNSRLQGSVVINYLPNHYHYLQFAYYKEGSLAEAMNAAASYLVLLPNDSTMLSNMEFYETQEDASKLLYSVQPEEVVEAYRRRKEQEHTMIKFAKQQFWGEEEQEFLDELYRTGAKSVEYQDKAEPFNPDEVRAGFLETVRSGQSIGDALGDDRIEIEYLGDDEATVEYFPEGYFKKPEEVWLEEAELEVIEEEGPMFEYSPEPGVVYGSQEATIDNDQEFMSDIKKTEDGARKQTNDPNQEESEEKNPKIPTNLDQKTSDEEKEKQDDLNSGHLDKTVDEEPDDKSKTTSASALKDKSSEPPRYSPATKQKIKRMGNSAGWPDGDKVEGVSALDELKKSAKKELHLFPSGPPRAGPSRQGRKHVDQFENESDEDESSYVPSLEGVRLYMNSAMLNGTNRMAVDNIASHLECHNLIQLMDIESKMGDGYNGKVYPHTKFESFEGMTVTVAVNAAKVGRVPLVLPATYMHLAEKSRTFMKKYFGLKNELYFSYSHLVCRTAEPDSTESRTDFSHPIHADNCQLDDDMICHKEPPAFTWRDWSAVLYLNNDFVGGEFIFAHSNLTIQSQLKPECGRLVGFSAGEENLHGVKAVISGRRCALALWFTEDARYQEGDFNIAVMTFKDMWEQQKALRKGTETSKTEL